MPEHKDAVRVWQHTIGLDEMGFVVVTREPAEYPLFDECEPFAKTGVPEIAHEAKGPEKVVEDA